MVGDAKLETELLNKMDKLVEEYHTKLSPAQLMGCFTFEQYKLYDMIKMLEMTTQARPKIEQVHSDLKSIRL